MSSEILENIFEFLSIADRLEQKDRIEAATKVSSKQKTGQTTRGLLFFRVSIVAL